MPIPAYMRLKDDGGSDIKGSVDVQDRNGSIEIIGLSHGLSLPVEPANGKITGPRLHSSMTHKNALAAATGNWRYTREIFFRFWARDFP